MSFRGRGGGRGRGPQHPRVDARELQLVYESCNKQEQKAVEILYKGKWGVRLPAHPCSRHDTHRHRAATSIQLQVNNTEIPPDALQCHLDKLFTASVWHDDDLIETKKQLNMTKDKMDDIPLQYVTLPKPLLPVSNPTGAVYSCSCLLYTSPSPRDLSTSRMPSSA